jgi:hypothetical protein
MPMTILASALVRLYPLAFPRLMIIAPEMRVVN